jgi:hypothetical protein
MTSRRSEGLRKEDRVYNLLLNCLMAYFIVLERKIEGVDSEMDGKGLSRHIELLDSAAVRLGVRPLSEFFSISAESAQDLLGADGFEDGDFELPPLQQFSAREGLETVKALLADRQFLSEHVIVDLHECERILTVAADRGVVWHFEIDI